jgi:DNA-binding NtrC family response regulator
MAEVEEMTLADSAAEIESSLEHTRAKGDRCSTPSARILVVDDELMIRELLTEFLQEKGFECECARSGEEALKHLKQRNFSLLLTDLSMPGLGGLDLVSYVANQCPDMAVIVITAIYELGTAVDSSKLGAYDYITKPFELEKALQTVSEALRRRDEKLESNRQAESRSH